MSFLKRPLPLISQIRNKYGTPANQISKAMTKLSVIGKSYKKQKWYDSSASASVVPTDSMTKKREPSKQGIRRQNVLNKLFMRHITDMMGTGEISQELLGKGIQISRVKIGSDFNIVNVFWLATGTQDDLETEKTLKRVAGALKHELSELRVMGVVPFINFVKDRKLALVNEVDELLKIADYPEDYKPTVFAERLKAEFELRTPLSPEEMQKIQELEREAEIEEDPLPEMNHHVFGLPQDQIMAKIGREKEQVRAAWELYEQKSTGNMPELTVEQLRAQQKSEDEVRERFKKFINSREFNKREPRTPKIKVFSYSDGLERDEEADEALNFVDGDYLEEPEDTKR